MNKSKSQKTGGCKAAHFIDTEGRTAYKRVCPTRTDTFTLDLLKPFPIAEAQADGRALLDCEIAQMKRVTFTVGGAK